MKRLVAVLSLIVASGSMIARAEEGRIPVAGPGTISAPGHYIVTRDIQVASGDAILIDAQHVTLDLNAHRISSTATTNSTLIRISPTADFITLRNGRLSGGDKGVGVDSTVGIALFMDGLEIESASSNGIWITGAANVELSDSRLINNNFAMSVYGLANGPVTGRITGNTIGGGSACLALLGAKGVLIRDNMITSCGNVALQVGIGTGLGSIFGGNLIEHNTITDSIVGIYIFGQPGGNQVVGNVLQKNGTGIVAVSASNRIAENTVFASSVAGIDDRGPRNLIEGNLIGGTTPGCGLQFNGAVATDNSWRNNMLRGNTGGAVCDTGTGNTDAGGNIY